MRTFGMIQPHEAGMLAPISFPMMAKMDEWTPDGRRLQASGGGARSLPRTIYVQFAQADGHSESIALGRLDYIELTDDGNVAGEGWLVDTPEARLAYTLIQTGVLRHNSVDLSDTEYDYEIDEETYDLKINFTKWNIGATTIVGKPAFADAHATVGELMASMIPAGSPELAPNSVAESGPASKVTMMSDATWSVKTPMDRHIESELTASAALLAAAQTVPAAPFFREEADVETKITIDAEGNVYGHLGNWNRPHGSFAGRKRYIPRSHDGYASFMRNGPLVEFEDGRVATIETGPMFLFGGHVKGMGGKTQDEIEREYGDAENIYADVRIHDGKIGPWICGRIRPGATAEQVYAARCSPISGHWVNDDMRAIVSTTVEGFLVKGSGRTTYAESIDDDRNLELVASFAPPVDIDDVLSQTQLNLTAGGDTHVHLSLGDLNLDALAERVAAKLAANDDTLSQEISDHEVEVMLLLASIDDFDDDTESVDGA